MNIELFHRSEPTAAGYDYDLFSDERSNASPIYSMLVVE